MCKYVVIVVDALIFKDKLFNQLWMEFFYACGLPNVCGTIDRLHILHSKKLDKHVIIIFVDYYYKKKIIIWLFCKQFVTWTSSSEHILFWFRQNDGR